MKVKTFNEDFLIELITIFLYKNKNFIPLIFMVIKNFTYQETNKAKERLKGLKNTIQIVINNNTKSGNHIETIPLLIQCKKELQSLDQLGMQILQNFQKNGAELTPLETIMKKKDKFKELNIENVYDRQIGSIINYLFYIDLVYESNTKFSKKVFYNVLN